MSARRRAAVALAALLLVTPMLFGCIVTDVIRAVVDAEEQEAEDRSDDLAGEDGSEDEDDGPDVLTGAIGDTLRSGEWGFSVDNVVRSGAGPDSAPAPEGTDVLLVETSVYNNSDESVTLEPGDIVIKGGNGREYDLMPRNDAFSSQTAQEIGPGSAIMVALDGIVPIDVSVFQVEFAPADADPMVVDLGEWPSRRRQ